MPFAIGVEHLKKEVNLGTLCRSAYSFGASLIFTIGRRYDRQSSDTCATHLHIPVLHFEDWQDYRRHAIFSWVPIAVEIIPNAIPLSIFQHPQNAVYLLGAEDHGLSKEAINFAKYIISIPSNKCLNVAVAGSIVMYDRVIKV